MTHLVAYSGGIGSFFAAIRVVAAFGKSNTQLVFTDTKTEDEDLYRFINETIAFLGCELVTLTDGRDIWDVFNDVRYMGNSRIDPCSRVLKRESFEKWLKGRYSPEQATLYYGIDWTEAHREVKLRDRWAPYQVEAPLTEEPFLTKKEMFQELKVMGIEPPRLYSMGFPHNNCGGFCVKTGQAQFKLLWEKLPERYLEHEAKQEALFKKIGKRGFIRKTVNGKMHYLSMREFREFLTAGGNVDQYDFGGCECFT